MGPIATRRVLHRLRRRTGGLLALVAVIGAVVACHAQPSMADGGSHRDMGAMATMSMCAAALTVLGAAVAAVAIGVIRLGRWKAVRLLAPTGLALQADVPGAVPRAGPHLLQLLCVSRR